MSNNISEIDLTESQLHLLDNEQLAAMLAKLDSEELNSGEPGAKFEDVEFVEPAANLDNVPDVLTESVVEPVIAKIEPIVEPVIAPIIEPVVEPIIAKIEPIVAPIIEPIVEPIVAPIIEPIVEKIELPIIEKNEIVAAARDEKREIMSEIIENLEKCGVEMIVAFAKISGGQHDQERLKYVIMALNETNKTLFEIIGAIREMNQ